MSGIALLFRRDGGEALRADAERIARGLHMHGRRRASVTMMGPVALVHTLFAPTPQDAEFDQPARAPGGRFAVLFDGRIDNRAALAAELGIASGPLGTMADAELALRSWQAWGEAALDRWVGEFAAIVWDAERHTALAARSPFGHRPLNYHLRPDRLVIASMPKGLHALPDIPRQVDQQKIADALCQLHTDSARSYFEGICRVRPGGVIEVGTGRVETRRYYDLATRVKPVRYACDADYVEAGRALFDQAVAACLRSSGPVGAFLSGGLDSAAVAVTAARQLGPGARLPTFTWVPEAGWDGKVGNGGYGDERPYVEAIAAQHPALQPHFVDVAGSGFLTGQDALLQAAELPVRNVANSYWFQAIMAQAKDQGIAVMLDGTFGNFTLSRAGEDIFLYLWQQRAWRALNRELGADGRSATGRLRRLASEVIVPLGPRWLRDLRDRRRGDDDDTRWQHINMARASVAEAMNTRQRGIDTGTPFFTAGPLMTVDLFRWMMIDHGASDLGESLAGLTALHGVEMRDPFADRRIVEWTMGLPEDQFYRNGVDRWLMRRMVDGMLPDSVRTNRRRGIQSCDWHLRMTRDLPRYRAEVEAMGDDADMAEMIDVDRLRDMIDAWPDQSITDSRDPRRSALPVLLPLALQVGRFVLRVKGSNRLDPV